MIYLSPAVLLDYPSAAELQGSASAAASEASWRTPAAAGRDCRQTGDCLPAWRRPGPGCWPGWRTWTACRGRTSSGTSGWGCPSSGPSETASLARWTVLIPDPTVLQVELLSLMLELELQECLDRVKLVKYCGDFWFTVYGFMPFNMEKIVSKVWREAIKFGGNS